MRTLLVIAAVAGLTSPVSAQIPGVRFGQSVAEVQAVIGNIAPVEVTSAPNALIIFQGDRYITFCHGKAVSMQYQFGSSVNDFAAEVEEETARSGPPMFDADNFRTPDGEISTVRVAWDFPAYKLDITMYQAANRLRVTRTVTSPDAAGCLPGA